MSDTAVMCSISPSVHTSFGSTYIHVVLESIRHLVSKCMRVGVHVCQCVGRYGDLCVFICTHMCVCMCVCMGTCVYAYVHGCKCVGGCEGFLRMHACMPYYCSVISHQLTNDKVLLELLVCFGKTTIIKTYILYIYYSIYLKVLRKHHEQPP